MRRIFFTIFILFSIYSVNAQIAGIRAGFNMSTLKGEASNVKTNSTPGYYAGILVEINVWDQYLFLQPEVIYSRQGTIFDENTSNQSLNLSYINTPILFKTYVFNSLSLQAGPQVGLLVSSPKIEKKNNTYNLNKNAFDNVDVSAVFGASFYTPSGFFIEARYQLGMKNVFDASKAQTNNNIQWNLKNHVLSVGAGYLF